MKKFFHRAGIALAVVAGCALAGTVTTRDGKGFTGLVQFADAEHLKVGPAKGPFKRIALTNVVSATFDPPINPDLFAEGAPMAGKGTGALAAYHDRPNLKGRVIYRIDQTIDHQWRSRQPVFDLPRDYFSIRWVAELEPPVTGEYTFTLHANDGGKLQVGDLKLGRWEALAGFRERGRVRLERGKRVPFVLEHFDNYGEASARVLWRGPGFQEAPIPASQLYPVTKMAPKPLTARHGLLGCYFQNRFFYGDGLLAIDEKMEFTPVTPPEKFADKNYSVRWTGQLEPPHTEEYTFAVTTDEGIRLWVGGNLVVNALSNRAEKTFTGALNLERGVRYNIRLESVHRAGQGNLKATWASKTMGEAVIGGKGVHPTFEPVRFEESDGNEPAQTQLLGVFTWGGSRITGAVTEASDSAVKLGEGAFPKRISTVNVARIALKPVPERFRRLAATDRKGVLVMNETGSVDFIEGEFRSLKDGALVLNSVIFGVKVYELDRVLTLVLGKRADKPARGSRYELVLENGSLFHVRSFKVGKDAVEVDDPTVGKFKVPLAELDELRRID